MKTKFKKGDRVVAVKTDVFGCFTQGDRGTVTCCVDNYFEVQMDINGMLSGTMRFADVFALDPESIPNTSGLVTIQLQNQRLIKALKTVRDAIATDPMYTNTHRAICDVIKEEEKIHE